jgi:hypothetical protein
MSNELNRNSHLISNVNEPQLPQIQPNSSNPDKDKFLFFFEPEVMAVDCCCGCSLKTGVQIIAILFVFASLSKFFSSLHMSSFLEIFLSGLLFLLYFTAGVCILYSSMTFNFIYAHTAYFIYAIIFFFYLVDDLLLVIMVFSGISTPMPSENIFVTGIVLLCAILITLSIQLYMIWIVFSYSIHTKHKRYHLVSGYIFIKP